MTFAVIETGGKQYRVEKDQKIRVEKLDIKGNKKVFDSVLLRVSGDKVEVGTPYVKGAKVEAKILGEGRDKKKLVFRYHPKTRYRKKKGHRQPYTEIEITKV